MDLLFCYLFGIVLCSVIMYFIVDRENTGITVIDIFIFSLFWPIIVISGLLAVPIIIIDSIVGN